MIRPKSCRGSQILIRVQIDFKEVHSLTVLTLPVTPVRPDQGSRARFDNFIQGQQHMQGKELCISVNKTEADDNPTPHDSAAHLIFDSPQCSGYPSPET
jgi:hypothetical protein